jgi:hypothetical protein
MKVDILMFFCVSFVISSNFEFFCLRVYCIVFCRGYQVFLLLDSGCFPSAVLFALLYVLYNAVVDMVHRSRDVQRRVVIFR